MTLDTSQNQLQWRSYIFGPYYRFAQIPFPSVDSEKQTSSKVRISKIIGFIALALGGIPLLYRTIFMFMQLSTTTLFSLNWAFNFIFCMLSLHSVFSLITLFMLAKSDFYNDFTRRSLIAIKNKKLINELSNTWFSRFA
uniref:Uncharacterized protein n=1 Tax=Panagrolaimus sp. PS1159 TaxID=55785 RepID=A0AC35GU83_9BILA